MEEDAVSEVKAALLNFALNELCNPVRNHVYEYLKSEVEFSRHLLVPSAVAATQQVSNVLESVNLGLPVLTKQEQGDSIGFDKPNEESLAVELGLEEQNYETLLESSDADFESVFRMNRATINKLISAVDKILQNCPETNKPRPRARPRLTVNSVPTGMKVMLTSWLMGNNLSFKKAAVVFQVSKVTVYRIFHEICTILKFLAGKYIRWPTADECSNVADNFMATYNFPGVVGAIGYRHINIRPPENKEESIKFLKDGDIHHTVIVQAVVDNKLLFRDVCAGFPGKTPIIHALVTSPLYKHLSNAEKPLIQPNEHILGSSEYPQLPNLLTPYTFATNNRYINEQEEEFNNLHHLAYQLVDFSFTVLQERFPRLNYLDVFRPELAGKVIVAACVLHNFTILEKNEWFVIPDV